MEDKKQMPDEVYQIMKAMEKPNIEREFETLMSAVADKSDIEKYKFLIRAIKEFETTANKPHTYPWYYKEMLVLLKKEKECIEEILNVEKKYSPENLKQDKTELNNPKFNTGINNEAGNVFCKSMPLNIPINHFKKFTQNKSKNGEPFLTDEQFNNFINRAFVGNKDIPKQNINKGTSEYSMVTYVFHEFYQKTQDYFNTFQNRDIFIELLTDNFEGFDFKKVKDNFNKTPKKVIK